MVPNAAHAAAHAAAHDASHVAAHVAAHVASHVAAHAAAHVVERVSKHAKQSGRRHYSGASTTMVVLNTMMVVSHIWADFEFFSSLPILK